MQDLGSPLLPIHIARNAHPTPAPSVAIGVVAVVERKEDLHKIIPDRVFRYWPVVFAGLFNDSREIAATAVLHHDVEDSGVAIDMSVVVSYDVVVVEVFEDVSTRFFFFESATRRENEKQHTHTSDTICFRSRSLIRSKLSSLRANIYHRAVS